MHHYSSLAEYSRIDFQAIFESMPGSFIVLQPNAPAYTILAISHEMVRTSGREKSQVIGKNLFEVFPENPEAATATGPASLRNSLQNVLELKKEDQLPVVRYDLANAEGIFMERYWAASTKPVLNDAGEVLYLLHSTADVTEQILSQNKIAENESRFRNLLEQAPVAIGLTRSKDHVFENINPSMLRLIGNKGPREEVIGRKLTEVVPELIDQPIMKIYRDVLETGETFNGNEMPVYVNVNGQLELGYYNLSYTPLVEDGKVTGIIHVAVDVTEQVLARKKVEESERQVQAIIESSSSPLAVYQGKEMRIQFANQAMKAAYGKGPEVIGKLYREVLPELEQEVFEQLEEVYLTGQSVLSRTQLFNLIINGQQQTHYYTYSLTPLFNAAGEVYGLVNTASDVTDLVLARQKVEKYAEELRDSEQRFRLFVQASNDTLYRMSPDWQQMLSLEGKSFLATTDKPKTTWLGDYLPPEDRAKALAIIQEATRTKGTFELEHRVLKADGTIGWMYSRAIPVLNQEGTVTEWFGATTDITEQKLAQEALEESEQRFRIMADAAPNIIWALNPDTSLKYVNTFMLAFLGITLEQFVADNWMPYIHPDDLERTRQIIGEAIRERKLYHIEHRLLRHDGEYRWLLSQGAPSYYANGELYGYVGSAIDITEIKQAEQMLQRYAEDLTTANEELRASSKQLQETNEMLSKSNQKLSHINADMDSFIYTASHDLKAPISNIEGLMNAIREELPGESRQEPFMQQLFKLVETSIERFKQTISDLTEITKLQREDAVASNSQVNLAHMLQEVQLDLSSPIEQAQAQLDVDLDTCEPVNLSPKNVRSIIYNLLSNAVKYRSPARRLVIQVRCYRHEHYQVLCVRDNGLGMDLADESKVFGMFKRLHNHVEGSGVGLYIVKKIVENAGGKIQVQSTVNEGSTFQVYFRRYAE